MTLSGGNRLGPWKTIAIGPGRRSPRAPIAGQETVPLDGSSSPAIRCNSVLLPDPEGPVITIRAPVGTSQTVGCTAIVAVSPLPYVRAAPRQETSELGCDTAVNQVDNAVGHRGDRVVVRHHDHRTSHASTLEQERQDLL